MPIELKMPALSPTMEEGTLAKWLVKEGDAVAAGDVMAEIETDKATMEFEAVDEGRIAKILVAEGTDGVKVGTVIALIAEEGEDVSAPAPAPAEAPKPAPSPAPAPASAPPPPPAAKSDGGERIKASPLARRLAEQKGIELASLQGSGPGGRIVKTDVEGSSARPAEAAPAAPVTAPVAAAAVPDIPHEAVKLSNIRKTIARRLTESKQQVPHIYLTVEIEMSPLLSLREDLNASVESRGIRLSVNDLLIKALATALMEVPSCNVMYTPSELITFQRADISVAVSTPTGLITPIIRDANNKSLSAISTEMKDLAARARDGKLKPEEYQGGTASLSNMGMFGISHFSAVINPPQGMIMAVGAAQKRPWVTGDRLEIGNVMSATGSFDHRAIDGADGAQLMQAFKRLVERPFGMLA